MTTTRTDSNPTSRSARSSSRADAAARDEILDQLKEDHKRAKKAFRDFARLDPQDEEACEALVNQTLLELAVHAELEEDLFYPAARNALADEGLIDEAEVEHMTFRMLMEQLQNMEPSDEKFAATFTVLGEYLKHHIKEEEGEIFPGLSRARMNWRSLRDDMRQLRQERLAESSASSESPASQPAASKGDVRGEQRRLSD
jgi:hypothetical protein